MEGLTLAEPDVRVLISFVKGNKARSSLALQQYLKDFLVLIKKIQFYKLEFKTSCQQCPTHVNVSGGIRFRAIILDDPSSHDIEQLADAWFFVRLDNGGDFSKVLNARQQQLERGGVAFQLSQSFYGLHAQTENSGAQQYEGFVHDGSSIQI